MMRIAAFEDNHAYKNCRSHRSETVVQQRSLYSQPQQCTIKGNASNLPYICIKFDPPKWVPFHDPCAKQDVLENTVKQLHQFPSWTIAVQLHGAKNGSTPTSHLNAEKPWRGRFVMAIWWSGFGVQSTDSTTKKSPNNPTGNKPISTLQKRIIIDSKVPW